MRERVSLLNADTPDIEVVGEAGTGTQAVQLARDVRPDVVMMDIRMPGTASTRAWSFSPHLTKRRGGHGQDPRGAPARQDGAHDCAQLIISAYELGLLPRPG